MPVASFSLSMHTAYGMAMCIVASTFVTQIMHRAGRTERTAPGRVVLQAAHTGIPHVAEASKLGTVKQHVHGAAYTGPSQVAARQTGLLCYGHAPAGMPVPVHACLFGGARGMYTSQTSGTRACRAACLQEDGPCDRLCSVQRDERL